MLWFLEALLPFFNNLAYGGFATTKSKRPVPPAGMGKKWSPHDSSISPAGSEADIPFRKSIFVIFRLYWLDLNTFLIFLVLSSFISLKYNILFKISSFGAHRSETNL